MGIQTFTYSKDTSDTNTKAADYNAIGSEILNEIATRLTEWTVLHNTNSNKTITLPNLTRPGYTPQFAPPYTPATISWTPEPHEWQYEDGEDTFHQRKLILQSIKDGQNVYLEVTNALQFIPTGAVYFTTYANANPVEIISVPADDLYFTHFLAFRSGSGVTGSNLDNPSPYILIPLGWGISQSRPDPNTSLFSLPIASAFGFYTNHIFTGGTYLIHLAESAGFLGVAVDAFKDRAQNRNCLVAAFTPEAGTHHLVLTNFGKHLQKSIYNTALTELNLDDQLTGAALNMLTDADVSTSKTFDSFLANTSGVFSGLVSSFALQQISSHGTGLPLVDEYLQNSKQLGFPLVGSSAEYPGGVALSNVYLTGGLEPPPTVTVSGDSLTIFPGTPETALRRYVPVDTIEFNAFTTVDPTYTEPIQTTEEGPWPDTVMSLLNTYVAGYDKTTDFHRQVIIHVPNS